MKLSIKLLAALSAVALLAACESGPKAGGDASGNGSEMGAGSSSSMGYLDGDKHQVSDRVFFAFDSSVVDSDGQTTLQKQADYLKAHSGMNVTIEGHCDERGTREYNLALGERRANAAKNYLVSLGVSASRIQTISYGKERPAVIGDDESAWSQNRRAVTVKTAQ
ncbi:MAG TPA: peptidoglycan-associated lipoprotein Pal [Rickettsiales bacterium]|nr:peptidoglycan-associated lipoprotein Pal [Rickettsiales bacterium]